VREGGIESGFGATFLLLRVVSGLTKDKVGDGFLITHQVLPGPAATRLAVPLLLQRLRRVVLGVKSLGEILECCAGR
jgi:hypothetical protein